MSRVSARYAKSLLDLSLEKGKLEQVKNDIQFILDACKQNRELELVLKSPIIKTDKKQAIFKSILAGTDAITDNFVHILIGKRREYLLEEIAESFISQYRKHKNILTAVITTASGLDEELRNKVKNVVKAAAKSEVELIEKVNKELIGGYIIKIGDKQDDTSILTKLRALNRTFNENPYIKEL